MENYNLVARLIFYITALKSAFQIPVTRYPLVGSQFLLDVKKPGMYQIAQRTTYFLTNVNTHLSGKSFQKEELQ